MLNSAGNSDGKIHLRTYGFSGLSYLHILRHPAVVYRRTGTGHFSAQGIRQILKNLEILLGTDSAAARYQNFCFLDIYGFTYNLDDILNLYIFIIRSEARIKINNLCLCPLDRLDGLHNSGTNRGHLRTVIRAGNRCNRISSKSRTCHQQLIVFLLILMSRSRHKREITDIQTGAVCGKSGSYTRGNRRTQITADGGCPDQHNFRLEFIDDLRQCMCVRLGSVILQLRIVHNNDAVCTVFCKLISKISDSASDKNSSHLRVKRLCEISCLSEKFKGNVVDLVIYLLRINKYALIFFQIHFSSPPSNDMFL